MRKPRLFPDHSFRYVPYQNGGATLLHGDPGGNPFSPDPPLNVVDED